MKKLLFYCFIIFCVLQTDLSAQHLQSEKLDSLFHLLEKHDKAMGSMSVYHKGESVYQRSIGYANVENDIKSTKYTQYRIGSISKLFTATLVMQLYDEGKVSLDTKLSDFYPEIQNSDQITVLHLLQHQSGIFDIIKSPNFEEWMVKKRRKDEILAKINENENLFAPGEKRDYSNTNYILLTFILEDIEKERFEQILNKRILFPLNLSDTYYGGAYPDRFQTYSYEKNENTWVAPAHIHLSIPHGAGAIISTTKDLNTFINALFDGNLISESTLALMQQDPGIGLTKIPVFKEEQMVGLMGGMDNFRSLLVYMPKQDMAFAFSFNGIDTSYQQIVMGIFSILLNKDYDLPKFESE